MIYYGRQFFKDFKWITRSCNSKKEKDRHGQKREKS